MMSRVRWLALACSLAAGCTQDNHVPQDTVATEASDRGPEQQHAAVEVDLALAEQGDAQAQARLAVSFFNGRGTALNYEEAIRWAKLAAEQGNARAEALLAAAHFNGQGVSQDPDEAVRWAKLAAGRGDSGGQVLLGMAYLNGLGVTRDYVAAYMWLTRAASGGTNIQGTEELLSLAAARMTAEQIEEAELLAREWASSP